MTKLNLKEAITLRRLEQEPTMDDPNQNAEIADVDDSTNAVDAATAAAEEDPDRQGLIRTVDKAHLVYKRVQADGTYAELWIYNHNDINDEMKIRKAIISGTDIPVNKTQSPDGSQSYTIWTAGNAELLHITGLPN